jgi:hypothetical protein
MNSPSPDEIARIVEFGEAEAYADMLAAAPPELGCHVERIGSAIILMMPSFPITLFNRVLCLGLNEPATESMLIDIENRYQQANIKAYAVQIGSVFQPPELPHWLGAHHFASGQNWVKMIRPPDTSITIPTSLRIEQITPDRAKDFGQVTPQAFGMPPFLTPWMIALVGRIGWLHYVAYDNDTPVAAGAIYIHGEIGWLGIGGTLPTYRNRGAQGALMACRIRAASDAGCQWIITETGEDTPQNRNPSYHNMVRTGFDLAYQRANYIYQMAR